MPDNQSFRDATNFIKESGLANFGEIANKLGIKRAQMDNLRFGSKTVSLKIQKDLIAAFPETAKFFQKEIINEPGATYSTDTKLEEVIAAQEKLIKAQKEHIEILEKKIKTIEQQGKTLKKTTSDKN